MMIADSLFFPTTSPFHLSAFETTFIKTSTLALIGVVRIFDWGEPKSHAMTPSETLKEEFFGGQRYRRMEDQKSRPGVGTYLRTRSRRGLKPKDKMRKCLNWETCLSKEVYRNSNVSQTGVWGRSPQQLGDFS